LVLIKNELHVPHELFIVISVWRFFVIITNVGRVARLVVLCQ
jgi:hypothetical protein